LILGILYLTFQAFPIIFEEKHGFNLQSTGLTFLGIGTGMLLGLCTMPYWNRCDPISSGQDHPLPGKGTDLGSFTKGSIAGIKRSTAENRQRSSVS
jgi:hypothetical protein